MRGAIKFVISMLVVASVLFAAGGAFAAGDTAMRLKVGDKAPDFRLKDLSDPKGRMVNLSDYVGHAAKEKKVVMLEFWATWCDICKKEMPNLVRLNNNWKDKGFLLLSIVLQSGSVDDVKKIMREKRLNYPVLLDQDLAVATKSYGLAGPIPLKVVIDHKGIIRYSHVGENTMGADDDLPFVIEDLVKELPKR
jgi:peroxiredoxin